jgi:signal peptidase II
VSTPTTAGRSSAKLWRDPSWAAFLAIAATVAVADRLSKLAVAQWFDLASPHAEPGTPGGPTRVIGDFVRIAVSHNDGGIFGLLGQSATILGVASIFVIGVIILVEAREGRGNPLLTVALGLLLGGAIGNLIDRLMFGYVIDWVDTGIGDVRWYTFNVADAAISISIVLLLVLALFGHRLGRLTGVGPSGPGSSSETGNR